jgi:hypothetical protein
LLVAIVDDHGMLRELGRDELGFQQQPHGRRRWWRADSNIGRTDDPRPGQSEVHGSDQDCAQTLFDSGDRPITRVDKSGVAERLHDGNVELATGEALGELLERR